MDMKIVMGTIVRHIVSAIGAVLVTKGVVEPDGLTALVESTTGFILAIGVVGWSYYSRKKLAK